MTTSPTQHWNPEQYQRHARFVSDLGMPVAELLAPRPGERILDLGCGDGALSLKLAALGCQVVGVDASPEMVAGVRRALRPRLCDAQGTWRADYVRLRFAAERLEGDWA